MKSEQLLSLIAAGLILIIALMYMSFSVAPQFTTYLFLLLIGAFGFILTEQWKTHDAGEFENRFWTALAFCFSTTCLFCKDSPLRFSEDRRGIAWSIVCLCTYLCHIYDRDVRRLFLTRTNFIRKQRSADFNAENRAQAKLKVVQLKKLTAAIDQRWVSSTFLNIFFLSYVLSAEDQILNILSEANRDELNLIINDNHFELALILYKVKDHWVCKRYHRMKLLHLLSRERINDLNVRARVVLLDAIQRLGVSAQSSLEDCVKHILLSTKGDELSDLKCLMDSKGDIFSMHYLLFVQIRTTEIKNAILDHISKQARIQSALMGSMARRRNMLSWRKVLSDIDDTLVSSGGSFPKGVDISFPKQSIYPGCLAFYRELNLGTSGEDNAERLRHGDMAFISARPHVYKDVSESATYSKIRKLQKERGLHTSATLLAGSLDTGSRFLVTKDSEALAQKKYENFKEYLRIYPEFTCVFIGDNGQGDVRAAELVMHDNDISYLLKRTYIHVVHSLQETYVSDTSLRQYANTGNICYFSTYVDAAIDAYDMGLIRKTGLQRLMIEAVRDFFIISDDNWGMMNVETVRPRSYYDRQAKIAAAAAEAIKQAAVNSSQNPQAAVVNSAAAAAGSGGGRTRSDSFTRAVVNALSSITSTVSKPTNPASVTGSGTASTPSSRPTSVSLSVTSGIDVEGIDSKGYRTPPLQDSPPVGLSSARKRFFPPASPLSSSIDPNSTKGMSQGIVAAKQSLSSNSSTTSSLLSASKSLFGSSSAPSSAHNSMNLTGHNQHKTGSGKSIIVPTTIAVVGASNLASPPLPSPTLSFSLLDTWEIHRNRPSVYDGPYKSLRKVSGWTKRELRIRELNVSIEHGNRLLQERDFRHPGPITSVELLSFPVVFPTGRTVATPFGVGVIRSFRSSDGMYEILIDQTSLLRPKTVTVPRLQETIVTSTLTIAVTSDVENAMRTVSTESAAAVEETVVRLGSSNDITDAQPGQQPQPLQQIVGASIPASSTFTIRLFVPGMQLSELKR
jgi:hypothetical protein